MPLFNRGAIADAIARFTGFKGRLTTDLKEELVPILSVGDLTDSPYLSELGQVGMSIADQAAVAGELSTVLVQADANKAVQVVGFTVSNRNAAAIAAGVRLFSGTQIAALTQSNANQLRALTAVPIGSRLGTKVRAMHTGNQGGTLFNIDVPVNTTFVYNFPRGTAPVLFGNDQSSGQPPGFGITNTTANESLNVAFIVREWPLPG